MNLPFFFYSFLKLVTKTQPDIIGFQELRFEMPQGGREGPSQIDHILPHLPGYQVHFVFLYYNFPCAASYISLCNIVVKN